MRRIQYRLVATEGNHLVGIVPYAFKFVYFLLAYDNIPGSEVNDVGYHDNTDDKDSFSFTLFSTVYFSLHS